MIKEIYSQSIIIIYNVRCMPLDEINLEINKKKKEEDKSISNNGNIDEYRILCIFLLNFHTKENAYCPLQLLAKISFVNTLFLIIVAYSSYCMLKCMWFLI